jgi:hypothetical protein
MLIQIKLQADAKIARVYTIEHIPFKVDIKNKNGELKTLFKQNKIMLGKVDVCSNPKIEIDELQTPEDIQFVKNFISNQHSLIQAAFKRSQALGLIGGIPVIGRSKKENIKYKNCLGFDKNAKEGQFLGVIKNALSAHREDNSLSSLDTAFLLKEEKLAEVLCRSIINAYEEILSSKKGIALEKSFTVQQNEQICIIIETLTKLKRALKIKDVRDYQVDNTSRALLADFVNSETYKRAVGGWNN